MLIEWMACVHIFLQRLYHQMGDSPVRLHHPSGDEGEGRAGDQPRRAVRAGPGGGDQRRHGLYRRLAGRQEGRRQWQGPRQGMKGRLSTRPETVSEAGMLWGHFLDGIPALLAVIFPAAIPEPGTEPVFLMPAGRVRPRSRPHHGRSRNSGG